MPRRKLQVWLDDEDIDALDRARLRHGGDPTRTTFLKALIEHMAADPDWVPDDVYRRAVELDRERRNRRTGD